MTYSIAIPSYKRPERINKATYKMILEHKLQSHKIYVFLDTAADVKEYTDAHTSELKVEYVIHGKKGLVGARNYMTKFFKQGSKVLYLDDDFTGIQKGEPSGLKATKVFNLAELATKGFALCDSKKLGKWGLNPSQNQRSLKNSEVTFDLRYIGGCYGEIVNHKVVATNSIGEDFERTIQYYILYGGVIRFNNYSVKTVNYAPGGMEAEGRDINKERLAKEAIEKKYPKYAKTYKRTEGSGRTDIRLIKNPKSSLKEFF